MGRLEAFFNSSFSIDKAEPSEITRLNKATRAANAVGNFCLSPARHLFGGKSMTSIVMQIEPNCSVPMFHHVDDDKSKGVERVLKTLGSVLLVIPGVIVGGIIKGITFLASNRLRNRNFFVGMFMEGMKKEPFLKQTHEVMTALGKWDIPRLKEVLTNLKQQGQLGAFLNYYKDHSYLWMFECMGLFSGGTDPGKNERRGKAMAGLLDLLADDKIKPAQFATKMKELSSLGIENSNHEPTWIDTNIATDIDVQLAATKIFEKLSEKPVITT